MRLALSAEQVSAPREELDRFVGGGPPARDWADHLVQVPHKKLRVTISATISDLLTFDEGDSVSVRSEEVTRGSMCIFLNSMTLGRVRAYFLPGNEP